MQKECVCFQDALESRIVDQEKDDDEGQAAVANTFFDLANTERISYKITPNSQIVIQQDVNATTHTGGIVWETSYLLLNYLRETHRSRRPYERLLEIGAGCGLVGLGAHKTGTIAKQVIITETREVMTNLLANRNLNYPEKTKDDSLQICELDWNSHIVDCKKANIRKHSIDCVVGTDVVFSTILVEPLLKTMKYLSHKETVGYLCLQERCKDSHALLLKKAKDYGFHIEDISSEYESFTSCKWGKQLECCLLKFIKISKRRKKKRKREKENDD